MLKKYWLALSFALFALLVVAVSFRFLRGHDIAMLNPHGIIAAKQRHLMLFTILLGMIVIIPVFIMAITIAWRYREGNQAARYTPEWSSHRLAEITWWGVPLIIISVLSVITWQSSHALDPSKHLQSDAQPITIQVVALDWKWLFIYPDQAVASVNSFTFPINTPVTFQITADAPMNSFWIPQLGGQIYAMPGMVTQLNLMADKKGNYLGSSANISGTGFASMHFTAHATSLGDYSRWLEDAKKTGATLDRSSYRQLAIPSQNNPRQIYGKVSPNMYDTIVASYMSPMGKHSGGTQ